MDVKHGLILRGEHKL